MTARPAVKAYQHEAARLDPAELHVAGKTIRQDAGLVLGPLAVRFSATDYEFSPTASPAPTPFADVLDTASVTTELADVLPPAKAAPSLLPPVLAAASYTREGGRVQKRAWIRERRRGAAPDPAGTTSRSGAS